jgi:hypothetical protein
MAFTWAFETWKISVSGFANNRDVQIWEHPRLYHKPHITTTVVIRNTLSDFQG